jgi:hypothetical protein
MFYDFSRFHQRLSYVLKICKSLFLTEYYQIKLDLMRLLKLKTGTESFFDKNTSFFAKGNV